MALLAVTDVVVHYGSVQAVHGVSLSLDDGQVLGVLGPNGAGKSSLLKCIAGVVRQRSGTISLNGRDLKGLRVQRRVGLGVVLAPEGRGLLAGMTVEENLRLGGYASAGRLSQSEVRSRLAEAISLFPTLGERRVQTAGSLSGGEASMLTVARALMSKPAVLLLDEPTLGLAPLAAQALFERLQTLKVAGQAMVIVEQRAVGLLEVADRVVVMNRGDVIREVDSTAVDVGDLLADYFGQPQAGSSPAGAHT